MKSASTPRWVRTKLAAMSQGQASPAETRTLDNDEVSSGDHALQELVTIKSMEMQTRASCVDQCDDSLTGTSYSVKRSRRRRAVVVSDGDIRDLCLNGQPRNAIHILEQRGIDPSAYAYVCLLRRCTNLRDIVEGKYVHAHMTKSGFVSSTFVLNALLNMYMKCGSLVDAREVFDNMRERDMFTWTMMLTGYSKLGYHEQAYEIYEQMHKERVPLDKITFTTILSVCASLGSLEKGKKGRILHLDIVEAGFELDLRVGTALVNMFSKCGSLKDALHTFDKLPQRNVFSWTSVIAACAQVGKTEKALEFYEKMLEEGIVADKLTYTTILRVCATLGDLKKGREVHDRIVKSGITSDLIMESTLIDMYAKCGRVEDAHQLLENMNERDVVSFTAVVSGYVQQGQFREALIVFHKMQREGVLPNTAAFLSVLKACAGLRSYAEGRRIHASIVEAGLTGESNLEHALADMYAKCDSCSDAHEVSSTFA
ncbi:hypothetical protein KC19_5G058200 [Ceratodon purpureus]|nr:hypothetical protein KC19_5G058200 [Ceratodon purpureus]